MGDIEHIFFDLDRTLWDFDTNSKNTLIELFHEYNLVQYGFEPDAFVSTYFEINDRMWSAFRRGDISKERLRITRFIQLLETKRVKNVHLAEKLSSKYIEICPKKSALVDDAVEVVEALSKNYKMHIITNGFRRVQRVKLVNSGLNKYFEHLITSEDAGAAKPHPDIFSYAEKLTGVAKSKALMIGDHEDIDVLGANNFGWKSVWFTKQDVPSKAHHVVQTLKEFEGLMNPG